MAGFSPIRFVVLATALVLVAQSVAGDGAVMPGRGSANGAPVYGNWTTPQPSGRESWTTPGSSSYGTWQSPQAAGYGTWATSTSNATSSNAYGRPATPYIPATATVVAPTYRASQVTAPPCAPVADICDPCATSAWRFGAFARYWRPSISGEVFITRGGVPGSASVVDVDDDMNLKTADAFEGGVSVGYGRHRATLAYEHDPFSGSSTLERPIVYRGVTFPAGDRVESSLDLDIWKLGYDCAFAGAPDVRGGFTARAGIAAWLWQYDGRIRSTISTFDEERSFSHVLPVASIAAETTAMGWLHLGGKFEGGLVDTDRYVISVEATAGVMLNNTLALELGYRWMNLSFHETTNEADLTLMGPFLNVSLIF